MHARSLARALGAAAVALTFAAGAAGAQGKAPDKAKADAHGSAHADAKGAAKGAAKGGSKGAAHNSSGVSVEVARGGQQPNARGGGTPPGLAKKPGGMPPGQYKKRYGTDDGVVILRDVFGREGIRIIRVERSGDRRFVFYRSRTGTVQRAVVSPGTERPTITGAPTSVIGKVLSRMQ